MSDFDNLQDALNQLIGCGKDGPVVMEIASGTYEDTLIEVSMTFFVGKSGSIYSFKPGAMKEAVFISVRKQTGSE